MKRRLIWFPQVCRSVARWHTSVLSSVYVTRFRCCTTHTRINISLHFREWGEKNKIKLWKIHDNYWLFCLIKKNLLVSSPGNSASFKAQANRKKTFLYIYLLMTRSLSEFLVISLQFIYIWPLTSWCLLMKIYIKPHWLQKNPNLAKTLVNIFIFIAGYKFKVKGFNCR